jgi:hypothetical protein
VSTAQRQLDLFPSAQSAWQLALAALERFEIGAARAQIAAAAQASDQRESFREIEAAVDWLEAMGLSEASAPAALSAALWDAPEWSRAGELSPGATRKVLDVLARRLGVCSRTAQVDAASLARAQLLLGASDAARRALDRALAAQPLGAAASQRFDARLWAARADVWSREGHEDARLGYGRALALDPTALEPGWIADAALRELFEQLSAQHGLARARGRLLAEAWLARVLELPACEPEFGDELRRRRADVERGVIDAGREERCFALLLAEDVASDSGAPERRERMQELDAPLFARVLERRRQDQAQRRI